VRDLTRVLAVPSIRRFWPTTGLRPLEIEQPRTGDETRQWDAEGEAPFWRGTPLRDAFSCYFAAVNRNKRPATLNLKHEKGRAIVLQLAKDADVVVNNFVLSKMTESGLRYEVLRKENPDVVYVEFVL
jgi:succinate--hydroxymethylglutarate CoA-transferase